MLTSGTLKPLNAFESELQTKFGVKLENGHEIDKRQVSIQIVSEATNGAEFQFNFKNRDSKHLLKGLGESIAMCSNCVKGGSLVFFPSYGMMDIAQRSWNEYRGNRGANTVEDAVIGKEVFYEPKSAHEFNQLIGDF